MTMDATLAGHLQELRRGTVVVASLTVLRTPGYGYSLLETLSRAGFEVEANTLYPLLRRLEAQGLLTSEWNTDETRPRKFYRTTEQGEALAETLRGEWARLNTAIGDLSDERLDAAIGDLSTGTTLGSEK
ncbi:PadR family transcriptional regulator [Actinoplanes cyaneus]|uniref:PadR family transcriptional regulator n=1 Tax=Actinoplanes cyaneus TaxID=52696 RepID=A0A919LYZ8_9ACTN|nr:PadR family transcriptional regulator [Actinoplanes cyaneus]MCW2137481.1 transcriptional regulator, PadR family [Actinoplanes cyaneus]GID63530.1 PadR family transcriptional regulator [Actinoplanes cyaneus]